MVDHLNCWWGGEKRGRHIWGRTSWMMWGPWGWQTNTTKTKTIGEKTIGRCQTSCQIARMINDVWRRQEWLGRLHLVRTTSAGGRFYALVVVVFVIHSFGVWIQYTYLMKTMSNSTENSRQKWQMASSVYMQIEHKLSSQMEHSTEVPLLLMISRVSPDTIPGLVI